jgi:hypothetical protein
MKKIYTLILAFVALSFFNSCTDEVEAPQTNYITFGDSAYRMGIDPGASATVVIPVYTANITGADRVYDLTSGATSTAPAGSFTLPSSITIPAGTNKAELSINVTDTNLDCFNELVVDFPITEGLSNGGSATLTYFQNPSPNCATPITATLDFVFDAYASEISWEVQDVLGGTVLTGGGNYADGQGAASESITLCANRCYTLVVRDSYGDGLGSPGVYNLTVGGVVKATGSGNFGDDNSSQFDTK